MKVICFLGSGGTGKTSTVAALADGLAIKGKRVLVIDLNSNMNLSIVYGDFHLSKYSIYDVLCYKGFSIYDAIHPVKQEYFGGLTIPGKVDIIPANSFVDRLQKKLDDMMHKEERLLRSLQQLNVDDYDFILIDTAKSPVTDIVITNVLMASDEVLFLAKLEVLSLNGIKVIYPRIEQIIKKGLNSKLKINGILCTQVWDDRKDINTKIYNAILDYAKEKEIYVYNSYIRDSEQILSLQFEKKSVFYEKNIKD